MQQHKPRLMRKLLWDNKWLFLAALICTVFTVVIEFVTPIVLAETLDYYLKLGPAYYSLLFERMDEWADAKVLE